MPFTGIPDRSEYLTGPARLVAPKLSEVPVETCLDCEQEEHRPSARIVGWVLLDDTRKLKAYAEAIAQGGQTVLVLSNGTSLKVTALTSRGNICCAPTN
jgi:NAD-dependent SIR2 family protein deacetylase